MILQAKTHYGVLEGFAADTNCALFRGIPYARPPVGDLRFRAPLPPAAWEGVLSCKAWPAACPQETNMGPDTPYGIEFYSTGDYPPHMDEDCLYLNIWTPAQTPGDKLPVMLWIHGGGVQTGYGHEIEFDGAALAKRGVILITINYRLNVFGFFSHRLLTQESGHNASGNYGIMDQIQALKWVKENISAFGGDPENITVFGQSGGGRSTQALACSPLSRGLLHRAAIQSAGGVMTGFGRIPLQVQEARGDRFFKFCGITSLQDLRALPWQKLLELFRGYMQEVGMFNGFNICTDGWVLPESLEDTVIRGHNHDIPYIVGCTVNETHGNPRMNICASQRAMAKCQLEKGKQPMYLYVFERALPGTRKHAFENQAFHSSELWYLFGTLSRCWRPFTPEDEQLSEQMMDYWTNFAKTGNPNGSSLTEWKPFTSPDYAELTLSTEGCTMSDYSMNGEMERWEQELLHQTS